VEVVEKNTCPGLCKNTMQTSELQSPKIEIDITHQGKNIMQTSEVQCSKIENDTGRQCSVIKMQHLQGEVQCLKIETEMDHLNSDTKKQYLRDDIHSNKKSLKIFHQNTRSLRNKMVNLKILLNTNLLNIDVFGFTEHWLIDDEISCYNLPNLSLVNIVGKTREMEVHVYTVYSRI
jgi:DNA mismatch repair ATPase MutL